MTIRKNVLIFLLSIGCVTTFAQVTIETSKNPEKAPSYEVVEGEVIIHVKVPMTITVPVNGDCSPKPRKYIRYKKILGEWKIEYKEEGKIIHFCGPSELVGNEFSFSFRFTPGLYRVSIPINGKLFYTGEIKVNPTP